MLQERPQRRVQAPRSHCHFPYVDGSSRERRQPRKAMAPKNRDNQNYDGNSCYFDVARGSTSRKSDHRSAVDYWRRGTCTASERPCKWPSTGSSMACYRRRTRHNTNRRIDPVRCEMQRSIGPTLHIFRTQMSYSCGLNFYFCSPIESVSIGAPNSVRRCEAKSKVKILSTPRDALLKPQYEFKRGTSR